jgi:hypothetical protein
MIEKALRQKLVSNQEITQIVGTRVYPIMLPEKVALPALVFGRVSTNGSALSHSGSTGVVTTTFEVGCIAKDVEIAKKLARLIRASFSGFAGSIDGYRIYRTTVENEFDEYDPETGTFQVPIEIYLTHDEG